MELSEYVQRGFQRLADPGSFDSNAFALLLRAAFQSLLDARADEAALDHPGLKHIDPVVLKHCHAAAATYILEAGKHRVDRSTLSTYLEDCKFDQDRIEIFCTEYQNNKNSLEILLGSIGRSLPHITDVSWRLEYQIKTNQLHKMYQPGYLVTLNVEHFFFFHRTVIPSPTQRLVLAATWNSYRTWWENLRMPQKAWKEQLSCNLGPHEPRGKPDALCLLQDRASWMSFSGEKELPLEFMPPINF
ncbi:polycomb complex protein BMI-1-like protein [Cricetulus griseus]|nr:polycomb complex protein BMI-1-like protein [Cricetulus griseus]